MSSSESVDLSSSASKEDEWERKERLEAYESLDCRRGFNGGSGGGGSFLGGIIRMGLDWVYGWVVGGVCVFRQAAAAQRKRKPPNIS